MKTRLPRKTLARPLEKRLMLDAALIADIGNALIWLDGTDQSTILDAEGDDAASGGAFSGTVATWQDKSGNGNHALQSTGGAQPSLSTGAMNGNDVIAFDGNDLMGITVDVPETDYTQFVIYRSTDTQGAFTTITDSPSYSAGSHDRQFGLKSGGKIENRLWNTEIITSAGAYNDGNGHIAITQVDSTNGQDIWLDNVNIASGVKTSSDFSWQTHMTLGGHTAWGYYTGDIAEVLFFNSSLDAEERHDIENYLADKWGITVTNLAPSIVNKASSANTGATISITGASLTSTDADNTDARLIYTVSTLTANGTLKLSGVALNINDTFTQGDVNNNLLTYTHNGSGTTTDSFDFTVNDRLATSAVNTFNISVDNTYVNAPPILSTNAGITAINGVTSTVTAAMLQTTDADTAEVNLTYTLTSSVTNGTLKLGGVLLTAGDHFTQDNIANNLLTYTHNGSAILTDSFDFVVSDGASTLPAETANINIIGPLTSLAHVGGKPTGTYTIIAGGETFDGYVDNDGTSSWLLIGRGREGWEFDSDGQGTTADIVTGIGTTAGFTPAAYNTTIINDLINYAGQDLSNVEIRIKRAANITGSAYQEVRWNALSQTTWAWQFDGLDFDIQHDVQASVLGGAFLDTTGKTRDAMSTPGSDSGNNYQRIFTWGWGSHAGLKGFAYGSAVNGVDNNDPNTFLWENTTEAHAIPYTEVYIRFKGDHPSVTRLNTGAELLKGTSTTLENTMLDTDDIDTADTSITYRVTDTADNGTLYRNGVALTLNDTFTQDDINNHLITYEHDGSATALDRFDFTVTDGTTTLSTNNFSFSITEPPANEPSPTGALPDSPQDPTVHASQRDTASILKQKGMQPDIRLQQLIRSTFFGEGQAAFYGGALSEIVREGSTAQIHKTLEEMDNEETGGLPDGTPHIVNAFGEKFSATQNQPLWQFLEDIDIDIDTDAEETGEMPEDVPPLPEQMDGALLLEQNRFNRNVLSFLSNIT